MALKYNFSQEIRIFRQRNG